MEISEVARQTGVPASTIRYYEEKGLIKSIGRRGLQRVFSDNVVDQLSLIALGQVAGFSLEELGVMLGTGKKPTIDRAMLLEKAADIDRSITKMTRLRDGLKHAAECSAPSHLECPKFRRLMGLAIQGTQKARRSGQRKNRVKTR